MTSIYLESADQAKNLSPPLIQGKMAHRGRTYTYLGSAFLKDKSFSDKWGKSCVLAGSFLFILFTLGTVLISKSYRDFVAHCWESCIYRKALLPSQVYVTEPSSSKKLETKENSPKKTQEDFFPLQTLPNDIKKTILLMLDSESFLAFYVTSRENKRFIKQNIPKKRLQAQLDLEAIRALKASSHISCNDYEDYGFDRHILSLMKSFPKGCRKLLENLLIAKRDDKDFSYLLLSIIECFEVNPEDTQFLLKKAKEVSHNPEHFPAIALALSKIDPEDAFPMAQEIQDPKVKSYVMIHIAMAWLSKRNEGKAVEILKNIDREFAPDVLKALKNLPAEIALPIVESIEREPSFKLVKTYAALDQFDKALEIIKGVYPEIDPYFVQHDLLDLKFRKRTRILIDIYLKKLKKFPEEADFIFDQINTALEQFQDKWSDKFYASLKVAKAYSKLLPEKATALLLDAQKEFSDYCEAHSIEDYSDNIYQTAKVLMEFDLPKAKAMADTMKDHFESKIDVLLDIAERYKKINSKVSSQILDEALLLISDIPNGSRGFDFFRKDDRKIRALTSIARHYASLDPQRSKRIFEKARTKVKKGGFGISTYAYAATSVIPMLAEGCLLIDPKRAIKMVNKKLAEFDNELKRVDVFLDLSKIVEESL